MSEDRPLNSFLFLTILYSLSLTVPLIILEAPIWVIAGVSILMFLPFLANSPGMYIVFSYIYHILVRPGLYIWALIVAVNGQQDFIAIAFYILAGLQAVSIFKNFLVWLTFLGPHSANDDEDDLPLSKSKDKAFFADQNYKKNSTRLLNICEELIVKYQTSDSKPSCKSDLLELIKSRVLEAKAEIIEWKDSDTDYIKIAHTMLAHATFDLLASGRYHIYAGMLNPMSCAENLMDVYKASMEYGVRNNLLDEETRKEQYEYLLQCISEVG